MDTICKPYLVVYPPERVTSSASTAPSLQWTNGQIDLHLSLSLFNRERRDNASLSLALSLLTRPSRSTCFYRFDDL